jgi:hypothetical protein
VAGVIIGMPRWHFSDGKREVLMATEYSQYEGAILKTVDIPIVVLVQDNLHQRGVFECNYGQFICKFPETADKKWLSGPQFQQTLNIWLADVRDRRAIFLDYCGSSSRTAVQIRFFLEKQMGASVLDWRRDFPSRDRCWKRSQKPARGAAVRSFCLLSMMCSQTRAKVGKASQAQFSPGDGNTER